jgi:hypothetical protein
VAGAKSHHAADQKNDDGDAKDKLQRADLYVATGAFVAGFRAGYDRWRAAFAGAVANRFGGFIDDRNAQCDLVKAALSLLHRSYGGGESFAILVNDAADE